MRLWSEVMVASESDDFVESVSYSLQDEGAVVVCVTTVDDAIQVLEVGFRPEALVVDGAMRSGPELVARVRRTPKCKLIPVIVAAPVRDAGELSSLGVTLVKREAAVVDAIQELYFGLG